MVTEILLGLIWLLLGIILCVKWSVYIKNSNTKNHWLYGFSTRNIVYILIILLSPLVFSIACIVRVIISDWD